MIKYSTYKKEMYILLWIILFNIFIVSVTATNMIEPLDFVGYWSFDDISDSIVYDESVYNNHGYISNAIPISGILGNGMQFNGKDSYISIIENLMLRGLGRKQFTLSAWIYPYSLPDGHTSLIRNDRDYNLMVYNGYLKVEAFKNNYLYDETGNYKITNNEWHHVCASWDGNNFNLYVDGILDIGVETHRYFDIIECEFWIGWSSIHDEPFNGIIDEVIIYDRVLSKEEVLKLFNIPRIKIPSVVVDNFIISNSRCDIDTIQNIRLHAMWDNGTDVSNGLIYINGREYITNSGGWIVFKDASSVVAKKTWKVTAINCSGIYDFVQVASSPSIIWDEVNIVLNVENSRIDIGTSARLHWTATYEYDGSPFQGNVNVKESTTSQQVGKTAFTVESIQDDKYGLTSFTSNQANCVWDKIKIVEGGVTEENAKVGNMVTVWFKVEYEYDRIEFTGQDGILYVNNVPLSWSSHDKQWKYSTTLDEPGSIVFEVTGVEDNNYGLTVINDKVGPLSITWERPFWETPVGIISIGGIIVVIVSASIFFLRKRI